MQRILAGLIAAALLLSLTQSADSLGLGREGKGFGKMGAQNKKASGGGGGGCAGPFSLDFSNSCNSQYVTIIH